MQLYEYYPDPTDPNRIIGIVGVNWYFFLDCRYNRIMYSIERENHHSVRLGTDDYWKEISDPELEEVFHFILSL